MSKRDYYEVLGVAKNASAQEIKSSYRKLAVRFHPDKNPGDKAAEEQFKEAAEAYAVLSDPEKRARYDRFGHQADQPGFGGFDPSTFADFSDILGDLFGFGDVFGSGRRRGGRGSPGADLRYDLSLKFEEAAFGREVEIRVDRLEACETCSGTGGKVATCNTCQGAGRVRYQQGFFSVARPCPQCNGEGEMVTQPCTVCRGEGRTEKQRKLKITVPPGVDAGLRLRMRGEGEHGRRGGPPGDLDIMLRVEAHPFWERKGADVYQVVALTYSQLVLGTTLEVKTLRGSDLVKVPAGTAPGHEIRLRHQGIQHLNSERRGDHVIKIGIEIPQLKDLSEEHAELLRQLAELEGAQVANNESVLEKAWKKIIG